MPADGYVVECPICLSDGNPGGVNGPSGQENQWMALEDCGHVMCRKCLGLHLKHHHTREGDYGHGDSPRCPICRGEIASALGITSNRNNRRRQAITPDECAIRVFLPVKGTSTSAKPNVNASDAPIDNLTSTSQAHGDPNRNLFVPETLTDLDKVDGDAGALGAEPSPSRASNRRIMAKMIEDLENENEGMRKESRSFDAKLKAAADKADSAWVNLLEERSKHKSEREAFTRKSNAMQSKIQVLEHSLENEQFRVRSLQGQLKTQCVFSETSLDVDSIKRRIRGLDPAVANHTLLSALAFRNQEYNKLSFKVEELEEHHGSENQLELIKYDNARLKDKVKRLEDQIRREATSGKKKRSRDLDGQPVHTDLKPPTPLNHPPSRRSAASDWSLGAAAIGSRGGGAAPRSFVTGRGENNASGKFITEVYDAVGGRRKVLRSSIHENAAGPSAGGRAAAPLDPYAVHKAARPTLASGGVAIGLGRRSYARAKADKDETVNSGLVMEHFFSPT